MHYRAFLSYSHADRNWARWLHRALESYRPPRKLTCPDGRPLPRRLAPVFRDRDELPSTADLSEAVNEALEHSDNLIVICSPAAVESHWVNEEIRTFQRLGRADRILCLIVDGEPGADDGSDCFPGALLEPDQRTGLVHEPVAADARPHADGRKNALLKIIAGMLGVGFDALKQRDLKRRHRRMVAVTAASMLIAALTISLAIVATIARQDAEYRQTQAENLVDYMLEDLRGQLHAIGRLDILLSIGDEALEYFASQRDADVSDRTLAQRARNLRQIGDVRMAQGQLDDALVAFNESLLITARLAERDPDDSNAQIGLANSHFYVGLVHWQKGELGEARDKFKTVLPIVNRLSELEPENAKWFEERGFAYTNVGRVLELEGDLEGALQAYEQVMVANRRLIDLEPANDQWHLEVGFAHNNIGKLVVAMGRLDDAEAHYRKDLDVKARIVEANPDHNTWRSYLGGSQYFLGQLLLDRGKFEEAEIHLLAALGNLEYLVSADVTRLGWQERQANIQRELGRLYFETNRYGEGRTHLAASADILGRLVQGDESIVGWRRDLARTLLVSAAHESRVGEKESPRKNLESALKHLDILLARESTNTETRSLAIFADVCSARLAMDDSQGLARKSAQEALVKIEEYFADSADPRILELRAAALAYIGRVDEAQALINHLDEIGFNANLI